MNRPQLIKAVRELPDSCIRLIDEGCKTEQVIFHYNMMFAQVMKFIVSSRCPDKVYLIHHLKGQRIEFLRQHYREKEYLRNAFNRAGSLLPVEFGFKRK